MPTPLFTAALALLLGAPAPGAGAALLYAVAADTLSPADSARAAARRRALARRDSLRREIARLKAQCGGDCDAAPGAVDVHVDVDQLNRVVQESVSAGMAGAAGAMAGAAAGLRELGRLGVEYGRDYDPSARDLTGPTRLDTTVSFTAGGTVDLSLVSGPVTVTAWNRPEVRVRGRSERLPFRFERADGPNGGSLRVYTVRARGRSAGDQQLDVVVPVGTRVAANSVSGEVRVRGVRGEVDAETVSGDVDVEDAARRVAINSVSGSVRARALDGDVRAHSVSGDVRIQGLRGEADVNTVSGDVELRSAALGRLRAQTVSGDLVYDGALARDGRYDLATQSGSVRLVMPGDASAALSLQTFSGSIDTSIPLTLQPSERSSDGTASYRRARRLEFTVGGGGARVTAQSFSGSIVIARASGSAPR